MNTLFTASDEEVLTLATAIMTRRSERARRAVQDETDRLYRKYGRRLVLPTAREIKAADKAAEEAGKPRLLCHRVEGPKLDPAETLLLYALDRNRFVVEMNHTQSDRWNGDATCKYGLQEGVICIGATSRHDLLLSLWAGVSNQSGDSIQLTEEHLNGAISQEFLKSLRRTAS